MAACRLFLIIIMVSFWHPVQAAGVFIEAGPGFAKSMDTALRMIRVQCDAPFLGREGFYEATYGVWNGNSHDRAFSLARGLRWRRTEGRYTSADAGIGHIKRTTDNLGTPIQFYFRFSLGRQSGKTDISLGLIHYSNGKYLFHWPGPNNGENFLSLSAGFFF